MECDGIKKKEKETCPKFVTTPHTQNPAHQVTVDLAVSAFAHVACSAPTRA